jgi:2-(1,2-epoxy-1,2-dihydrophenyl)acetyl-CoA isomerase
VVDEIDTGTDTVRSWIEEGVAVIELNRPERRNALHFDMYDAIPRLIAMHEANDAVGCFVLTSAGSAFCAGGDVRQGRRESEAGGTDNELSQMTRMVLMLHESPLISVAALPGPAAGAGIGIALCADLRIAVDSASLVPGWDRLAFSGDFGGPYFLARFLGPSRALEMLVEGTALSAREAFDLGIYNRIVPAETLREAALDWAKSIAAGPRMAHTFIKQNVQEALRSTLREALPHESDRMVKSGKTEEHKQAVKQWLAESKARRGK